MVTPMNFADIMALEAEGEDRWLGRGPRYPWGGLFGGQILSQSLRAASMSVAHPLAVHSLHAYFIRPGDHSAPIRFEVERVRDGRSFATRRVLAKQESGAIMALSASFQTPEQAPVAAADHQTIACPEVPAAEQLGNETWSTLFERRFTDLKRRQPGTTQGQRLGPSAWFRMVEPLPDDPVMQACALAYLCDDLPTEAVLVGHPDGPLSLEEVWVASLDHAMWFHRPGRAQDWNLHHFACHALSGPRGLGIGHVFDARGIHLATVSQEVVLRPRRGKATWVES